MLSKIFESLSESFATGEGVGDTEGRAACEKQVPVNTRIEKEKMNGFNVIESLDSRSVGNELPRGLAKRVRLKPITFAITYPGLKAGATHKTFPRGEARR